MVVCIISIQIYFLKGIATKSLATKKFQNEDKYQSQNHNHKITKSTFGVSHFSYIDNVSLYIII